MSALAAGKTGPEFSRIAWRMPPWAIGLAAAGLWLLPSIGQLDKYLGPIGASAVALLVLALLPSGFHWLALRPAIGERRAAFFVHLIVLAIMAAFAALYPLVLAHVIGGGSDREDALNRWLGAVQAGRYPYFENTFQGTPFSPLPGAAILALPAFVIGRCGLQNLWWLPAFIYFSRRFFVTREAQALFAGLFLLSCPASMQDFVTGGDYLVNCLYVLIAVDLVASFNPRNSGSWPVWAGTCLFFSICISSRQNYATAVPVLAAFLWQHGSPRRMLEFLGLTALFCAAINLPFYFYSPAHFPLFNQSSKFDGIPEAIHAPIVFPALAIAIALAAFAIRMSRERVYAMIAASFIPLFVLPLALWFWHYGPVWWVLGKSAYALPLTIIGGLWFLTMWRMPSGQTTAAVEATGTETARQPAAG